MNNLFGEIEAIKNTKDRFVRSAFNTKLPWIKKWKPNSINDIILPENILKQIKYQLESSGLKNMTFYGGPGVGKTTLALLIAKEMNSPVKFYNASNMKLDVLTNEIIPLGLQYVSGPPTIVILDECDNAGFYANKFWDALRNTIDRTIDSVRFILTGNYIYNIPEPILSRCTPINFQIVDNKLKIPIFNLLIKIAEEETRTSGGKYEIETIKEIARLCYPDIRRMINELEKNFDQNNGSIIGKPIIDNKIHLYNIYNFLCKGDLINARVYFNENISDYNKFFIDFCDFVLDYCDINARIDVCIEFAEYNFRSSYQINQEMNITCGLFGKLVKIFNNTNTTSLE